MSKAGLGKPVHAASFIRKREMVLETELRADPRELARIFAHELFHFVWARLGNARRKAYEELLRAELSDRARGELGWSAETAKSLLAGDRKSLAWRAYVVESFCDTAAFLYSGCKRHDEFTLAGRWRRKRAQWFHESFDHRALSI